MRGALRWTTTAWTGVCTLSNYSRELLCCRRRLSFRSEKPDDSDPNSSAQPAAFDLKPGLIDEMMALSDQVAHQSDEQAEFYRKCEAHCAGLPPRGPAFVRCRIILASYYAAGADYR